MFIKNKKSLLTTLVISVVLCLAAISYAQTTSYGETNADPNVGSVTYRLLTYSEPDKCTIKCDLKYQTRRSSTQECVSSADNDVNGDGTSDSHDDDTSGGDDTPGFETGYTDQRKGVRIIGGAGHGYGEAQAGGSTTEEKTVAPCNVPVLEAFCIKEQTDFQTEQSDADTDGTIANHAQNIANTQAQNACHDFDTAPIPGSDPQPYNPPGNHPLGHPTAGGNWYRSGDNNAGRVTTNPGPIVTV